MPDELAHNIISITYCLPIQWFWPWFRLWAKLWYWHFIANESTAQWSSGSV